MNSWKKTDENSGIYVKYNAGFTAIMMVITVNLIVIHGWNWMFLIGMFAVVLI